MNKIKVSDTKDANEVISRDKIESLQTKRNFHSVLV